MGPFVIAMFQADPANVDANSTASTMLTQADARQIPIADKSVHCIVTSPPYWGLRKYAGDQGDEPLGLEATPERHVERMVQVFRELRRILRDDGVVWLNYGDCYYNHRPGGSGLNKQTIARNDREQPTDYSARRDIKQDIGSGNLMMMPHRVALALQADGWIVRQDLVWYKRNPMPESVRGWSFNQDGELRKGSFRHTRAHEYVFMLVKGMQYWSDQEAVREAHSREWQGEEGLLGSGRTQWAKHAGRNDTNRIRPPQQNPSGRNPRSVLDVPTSPYKGAHYATFPPNLIAPLIRATCPRWACPVCGQGWAAVVEKPQLQYDERLDLAAPRESDELVHTGFRKDGKRTTRGQAYQNWRDENPAQILGYRPTCSHEHTQEEAVPGIVFDPFVGSGTTVKVAQDLLRRGIGIDISWPYLDEQARIRTGAGSPSNALDGLPLFN